MIARPDISNPCQSCGTAVAAGETECRRCNAYANAYAALASLADVTQRLLADDREEAP